MMNNQNQPSPQVETYVINWRNIEIQIKYSPQCFGAIEHFEIKSMNPPKEKLPITSTGYKSISQAIGTLKSWNMTPQEAVIEWLEAEAKNEDWKLHELKRSQLTLF